MENMEFDELYYAAKSGDLIKVKQLIDNGTDINKLYYHAKTPLIVAILHDQGEIIQYLIEKGADVNAAKGIDHTALELALLYDNPKLMKTLFNRGAVFDVKDRHYILTLLAATHANCMDSIRYIAERGIDLNVNDDGITCLISAAAAGHIKLVKMLLELGANPLYAGDDGRTAYNYAKKQSIKKILKEAMDALGIHITRYRVFAGSGNPINKNDLITAKEYFGGSSQVKRKDLIMLEDGKATDFFENLKYRRTLN
jgi:ankyrin repeat protein